MNGKVGKWEEKEGGDVVSLCCGAVLSDAGIS